MFSTPKGQEICATMKNYALALASQASLPSSSRPVPSTYPPLKMCFQKHRSDEG